MDTNYIMLRTIAGLICDAMEEDYWMEDSALLDAYGEIDEGDEMSCSCWIEDMSNGEARCVLEINDDKYYIDIVRSKNNMG